MSLRRSYPQAREPDSHYFLTISRGGRSRKFAIRPAAALACVAGVPLISALYLGAGAYMFFRDDVVANLLARQARQQYAYEDRISAMRAQLDKVTSRQLLDQDSFDGKVQSLINRQAQLETRTAIVAALTSKLQGGLDAVGSIVAPRGGKTATKPPPPSFAPVTTERPSTGIEKPRPEGMELRSDAGAFNGAAEPGAPLPARLDQIAETMKDIEQAQVAGLARLQAPMQATVDRLRQAIAETGLGADRMNLQKKDGGIGGPFIPSDSTSPFETELRKAQSALVALDGLRRALPYLPVRKPLAGPLEITSTFGYRSDPFLGRAALHSGLDLRAETGTGVFATATGKVVVAAPTGGYGNLVEIDHGSGIKTRYGHLSAILVEEGQMVTAGAIVGKAGSTGRSTGPHLHYEVRLDDEATDPARFVRASRHMLATD